MAADSSVLNQKRLILTYLLLLFLIFLIGYRLKEVGDREQTKCVGTSGFQNFLVFWQQTAVAEAKSCFSPQARSTAL